MTWMTEAQLSKKIIEYANSLPSTFAWKYPGTGLGISGIPDVIGSCYGAFFGIECKRPGAYKNAVDGLSLNQNRRIAQLRAAGAAVLITDSFDEAKEWLDEHCGT